jgi:hypothetical protein
MSGAAGAIRRAEPLRHDAFATKPAGVFENYRSVAIELIVSDTIMREPQKPGKPALARLDRLGADVLAINLRRKGLRGCLSHDRGCDRTPRARFHRRLWWTENIVYASMADNWSSVGASELLKGSPRFLN